MSSRLPIDATDTVTPSRLSDQVVLRLATGIIRGDVAPGESLASESQLAIRYGVSKPIVREALRELAGVALVRIQHGKRTVVRDPADWNVLDPLIQEAFSAADRGEELAVQLHELRIILETSSARHAASNATTAQRAQLTALVAQLYEAAQARDVAVFLEVDREFHDLIGRASGNQALRQVIRNVHTFLAIAWSHSSVAVGELRALAKLHEAIADAVVAGDPERATTTMLEHLEMAYRPPAGRR